MAATNTTPEVVLRHGDTLKVDYTPAAGDIAAGQVVLLGNTTGITCGVAFRPIDNTVKGALDGGGGVYEGINLSNAADSATVYWDDSVAKFTTTSTNNAKFGYVVRDGGGGANTNCLVLHHPYS